MKKEEVDGIITQRTGDLKTPHSGLTRACFDARHNDCGRITSDSQKWCACLCHGR